MPSDAGRTSTAGIAQTPDDALRLLGSGSPHERLRGARFFTRNARIKDLTPLKSIRAQETDGYVIRTLDLAIKRALPAVTLQPESSPEELNEETARKARNDAVEWVAGLLLHEIASPLGLIAEAASREVANYEASQLKTRITHLQRIFEGIEQIKSAIAIPKLQRFDLSLWLESTVDAENFLGAQRISFQGAKPFIVTADPKLLRFAVCNGMKNALEAVQGYETGEFHPLIVTWDASDSDYWIAIRDRGPGLVGPPQLAFEIGKTTKQGHSGFGLAIALHAMESMDGHVILQPAKDSGAIYEVRWPKT